MKDVLDEIVAWKRVEVERLKEVMPPHSMYVKVEELMQSGDVQPSMRQSLMTSDSGIIAEFKRKSPSKGWIKESGRAEEIPLSYQKHGAAALSILTDEHFFGGSDRFVIKARQSGVTLPILYKNFVIDEYHDEAEIDTAVQAGAKIIGVNNRNLGTFVTDVNNSFRLAELLPNDICKVSESGISSVDTVRALRQTGFNGFLIGENFMRASDPGEELKTFIEKI